MKAHFPTFYMMRNGTALLPDNFVITLEKYLDRFSNAHESIYAFRKSFMQLD